MALRIAFMGFRHGHIFGALKDAQEHEGVDVVAACEEDEATRGQLADGTATITHDSFDRMLDDVECDAIAIGDYYGRRGAIAIRALELGKHVIADKPICTSLDELARIAELARDKGLSVGCQLDLRNSGKQIALRKLIREEGRLGDVHAIHFGGQHPLNYGTRPGWYFEEGKHGGTINDIAIHAIDLIPWVTGKPFEEVVAARNWNAALPEVPHFKDAAQVMLALEGGCGVMGDVSYLTPNSFSYKLPMYWRITFWGERGVVETDTAHDDLMLYADGSTEVETVPAEVSCAGGYFRSFVNEIAGSREGLSPSTEEVLTSSRACLTAQAAADSGETNVRL